MFSYVYWQEVKELTLGYITYYSAHYLFLFCFFACVTIFNRCGINFGNVFNRLRPKVKS